jgi:hypothetical protein
MTEAAHASLLRAMNDPSEVVSPMCLFLQSINVGATSSSAQLVPSASSPNVSAQSSAMRAEPCSDTTLNQRAASIHPYAPTEPQPGFVPPPAHPGKPPAPAFDGPPASPHATTSAPPSAAHYAYPSDLYRPFGVNPANNVWNDQGYQAQHSPPTGHPLQQSHSPLLQPPPTGHPLQQSHSPLLQPPPTGHPLQQSHSPLLQPTGHAFPAQYSPAMQPTGNAFQPQRNPPVPPNGHAFPPQLVGQQHCGGAPAHMLSRVPNRHFQPQQMNQMAPPHVLQQRVACPHPETADRQWRQRRQKRSSSGAVPTTRQGVEQIKRTELAKVRQQEALLEAQLRRMREDSKEKQLNSVGLTAAVIEAPNSFKDFLKAEYEEGGYLRTF